MNSKIDKELEALLAFDDEKERLEHEADMISLKIALEINKYLEEKGISKKELASIIGTSPAYITQILRGDKRVNMVFLAKLSKKLDINLSIRLEPLKETIVQQSSRVFDYVHQYPKQAVKIMNFPSGWKKSACGSR